jgi:hypothetical protein
MVYSSKLNVMSSMIEKQALVTTHNNAIILVVNKFESPRKGNMQSVDI